MQFETIGYVDARPASNAHHRTKRTVTEGDLPQLPDLGTTKPVPSPGYLEKLMAYQHVPKPIPPPRSPYFNDDNLAIIFAIIVICYLLWVLEGLALGVR